MLVAHPVAMRKANDSRDMYEDCLTVIVVRVRHKVTAEICTKTV